MVTEITVTFDSKNSLIETKLWHHCSRNADLQIVLVYYWLLCEIHLFNHFSIPSLIEIHSIQASLYLQCETYNYNSVYAVVIVSMSHSLRKITKLQFDLSYFASRSPHYQLNFPRGSSGRNYTSILYTSIFFVGIIIAQNLRNIDHLLLGPTSSFFDAFFVPSSLFPEVGPHSCQNTVIIFPVITYQVLVSLMPSIFVFFVCSGDN